MKPTRRIAFSFASPLFMLLLGACDWSQFLFQNSIPVKGDVRTAHVYLAVDGLSPALVERARSRGVKGLENFEESRLIAMFPASSDSSWTRILRTKQLKGYELHYYDPVSDSLENNGYAGLVAHGLPNIDGIIEGPQYLKAFDYHADGYFDVLESYVSPELALGQSLDALFNVLAGRTETRETFFGYVAEIDIIGHMREAKEADLAFEMLMNRIERLRRSHPARKFVFTLFSDHGFDDIPAFEGHFVDFPKEMRRLGIEPVDQLRLGRGRFELYAVPIVHTPVSYLSLHTDRGLASKVAERCSESPTVDLAIAHTPPEPINQSEGPTSQFQLERSGPELFWFEIWRNSKRVLRGAHDPVSDLYYLHNSADLAAISLEKLEFRVVGSYLETTDEQLFSASANGRYPDLVYRVRTALSTDTVEKPAEVLISFLRPYTSLGFRTFSKVEDQARYSFHGSIDAGSSTGMVLTEERTSLPQHLRAEEVLDLFPRLQQHIEGKGIQLRPLSILERLERDKLP